MHNSLYAAVLTAALPGPPALSGYSPVSSMQMVATQHSAAITGSSGCSTIVSAAIDAEIQWSAANLKSMVTALQSHESDLGTAFTAIDPLNAPRKVQVADGLLHHAFGARPPFNPGTLVFSPAVAGPEAAETAESLLGKFAATNDAAVGDAITYWTNYASRMTDLAVTLADASAKLASDNEGAAFDAASASLAGLSGRVANVAASAGVLTAHLGVLPAVKAMAMNVVGSIEAQAQSIPDAAAREAFERAEIAAFIAGPYLAQLQTAVPAIPNLTQPDFSMSAADLVASGVTGGHGAAGASQIGLAPTGMTSAAAAPATAASSMSPASAGPITGPNGMNPLGGVPSGASTGPATSGPISTIPGAGAAPMVPAGTTAPAGVGSGTTPPMPNGMSPAGTGGTGTMGTGSRTSTGSGGFNALGGIGAGSIGGRPGGIGSGVGGGPGSSMSRGRGGIGNPGGGAMAGGGAGKAPAAAAVTRTGPAGGSAAGGASSSKNGAAHTGMLRTAAQKEANVGAIRGAGRDFEQDEYQRELFGDEPTTVPAVIGANVRG